MVSWAQLIHFFVHTCRIVHNMLKSQWKSSVKDITSAVSQGRIFGPLVFNFYINDILMVSKYAKYIMYADDVTLLCTSHSADATVEQANSAMERIRH